MPSDLDTFLLDLNQEVGAGATAQGEFTRTVLVENLARRLVAAEEIQDWTPAYYDGRGYRRRALAVDGYCTDELELDGTLQLIIANHREGTSVETLSTTDINSAFDGVLAFVVDALDGRLHEELEPSAPAADLARLIYDSRELIKTVRVLLISNGTVGARYKSVDRSAIRSATVELHIWDLVRFQQLAGSGGREEIDIDIAQFVADGIPALPAGIGDTTYQAYLCICPGKLLADIYEQYGSRILEGNVRAFLSARGKVNQGIRKTILAQPERFFAFNNGVTATASRVEFGPHGKIIRILDLQIVNGGQTTASLFNTRLGDKATLDRIYVQMKLAVLPADTAMAMIPEISRFANTQNKVSEADLFSNHPFNRRVEELSRRLWGPPRSGSHQMTHWFYERARAQYQAEQSKLTAAQKTAFLLQNPKDQLITKTDLAKFENSYAKLPHVVSLGAQKNFVKYAEAICTEFDNRPDDFNERWFQHLVAKSILFSSAERIVSSASWYTNAYRANIVTYSIAKLIHLVDQQFPGGVLDLDQIWKNQVLPEAVAAQIERTAKAAYDVLLSPPQEGANVTEWAKRKECWERVVAMPVELHEGLVRALQERGEDRDQRRKARGDIREEVTINAALEVLRRGEQGFWNRALAWRNARRLLTPLELGILETAVSRGAAWAPSDAQAKRLLGAAKKLEEDGLT